MFSFQIQINNSNIMVVALIQVGHSQDFSQVSSQDTHHNNQVDTHHKDIHHKADSPEDILEEVSIS